MMLNSRELSNGIITNIENPKCIQQVGIDLEVETINQVEGIGEILKDKSNLPRYIKREPIDISNDGMSQGWLLEPGYYEVAFKQGCNIPDNVTLKIRQRSSMLRSGGSLHSSIFDPGFHTHNIGTFFVTHRSIFIEKGARIAQIYGHYNTPVSQENLYNGQFQQDKQRKF